MTKKIVVLLLTICLCMLTTGCRIFDTGKNNDGKVADTEIEDGIYILTAKGEFYRPNTENQNFEENVTSADKTRLIWSVNGDKNIPKLYKDDKLVFFSTEEIPNSFTVEQFKSCGYTIGCIGLNEMTSGGVSVTEDNIIKNSSLATAMETVIKNSPAVAIYAIDDTVIKTNSKLFNRANAFSGMKKGSTHKVSIYAGTYYGEITATADTRVWSSYITTTTAGYARTTEGYVEVLYGDLEDGFYSFDGTGLIQIDKKNNRP